MVSSYVTAVALRLEDGTRLGLKGIFGLGRGEGSFVGNGVGGGVLAG